MSSNQYIEILNIDLLDRQARLIESLERISKKLGIQLGWHYILDLTWIASQLDDVSELHILDAGAGTGVLQWWLADQGAQIVSVDRYDRAEISGRFRLRYRVKGLRQEDLISSWRAIRNKIQNREQRVLSWLGSILRTVGTALLEPITPKAPGQVTLYQHDLAELPDLHTDAFDVVVSVSALEHNEPSTLPLVVRELRRVLKPKGLLLVTLAAASDQDWFHEPSGGWCLKEATLRRAFELPNESPSNFGSYASILEDIRSSEELRNRLAPAYFQSGDNGMPWGVWDPKYLPVGIRVTNS